MELPSWKFIEWNWGKKAKNEIEESDLKNKISKWPANKLIKILIL